MKIQGWINTAKAVQLILKKFMQFFGKFKCHTFNFNVMDPFARLTDFQ